jgi:hypothetical protein
VSGGCGRRHGPNGERYKQGLSRYKESHGSDTKSRCYERTFDEPGRLHNVLS